MSVAKINTDNRKWGLPLLLILSHRTRRQGAPLLTRFARSSTRRVAYGQPVTAPLRWDPSGLGQSRPIRPENDDVEPYPLYPGPRRPPPPRHDRADPGGGPPGAGASGAPGSI